MAKRDTHRVLPTKDGDWKIQRDGNEKPSHILSTKEEAVQKAREISRNQNTELEIHKKDGTIQQSDSHGNDPHPPKG